MLFSGFSDSAQNVAVFLLQAIIFFRLLKIPHRFQSWVTPSYPKKSHHPHHWSHLLTIFYVYFRVQWLLSLLYIQFKQGVKPCLNCGSSLFALQMNCIVLLKLRLNCNVLLELQHITWSGCITWITVKLWLNCIELQCNLAFQCSKISKYWTLAH
jgi:hypothetical protein